MFSKSKGKLNKRLFKVIESLLSIAVKYAKKGSGLLHENFAENFTYYFFCNVKITGYSALFKFRKGW